MSGYSSQEPDGNSHQSTSEQQNCAPQQPSSSSHRHHTTMIVHDDRHHHHDGHRHHHHGSKWKYSSIFLCTAKSSATGTMFSFPSSSPSYGDHL
ncbi:unnamed protein product [Cylicocyclus nassatus]|uniref:Uncharacterized protein n=1 Tax=Cylicocyclus nassatus TaxID=53992 RepID=A0AA36GP99_CYLNA|nr:unnamed protein product [Cylicocyclus nassatus]